MIRDVKKGDGGASTGGSSSSCVERVLVVDDDPMEQRLVEAIFRDGHGFEVMVAGDGPSALSLVGASRPDVVLLDLRLPGMSGLEVLGHLRKDAPQIPVIMMTAHAEVQIAVKAIQLGAYQFLTKPISVDEIVVIVRRAIEHSRLRAEVEGLRRRTDRPGLTALLGTSAPMQAVLQQIRQVAGSTFTVLVQGETGTGKELVARAIHEESARRAGPLVSLDCGAIPETLLESELFGHEKGAFTGAAKRQEGQITLAEGGTLFLDEIGNVPLGVQAKLLRMLQEKEVHPIGASSAHAIDVRIVAATNIALEAAVREARFRQDLFYRLAEFTITLPPLRERRDDIPLLAHRFREEARIELKRPVGEIDDAALALLEQHAWPGNVRELRNVIRQAVLISSDTKIGAEHIRTLIPDRSQEAPAPVAVPVTPGLSLKEVAERATAAAETQAIQHALRTTGGNKSQAARLLHVDYKTLYLKMKRYGLQTSAEE